MALNLTKNNSFGGTTSYWKVVDLNINWLNKISSVSLCGWTDEAARVALYRPTEQRNFEFSGDDFPFVEEEPQNEREIAYSKIKETEEFSEAIDC